MTTTDHGDGEVEGVDKPATLWPHLYWRDVIMFMAFLVDMYGDNLVFSLLVIYFETNFQATGALARSVKAAVSITDSLISFFVGPILDTWPRDAPLLATTYTKPVGLLGLAAVVVIDWHAANLPSELHVMLAMAALLIFFCPAEVLGAQAPGLTILRVCEQRKSPLVRPAMYNFIYATGNLCAELGSWTVFGSRKIWADDFRMANRAVFFAAMTAYAISAVASYGMSSYLTSNAFIIPRPIVRARKSWGWRPGFRAVVDEPLYDPCADCELSAVGCKRLTAGLRRREMISYLAFIASLVGVLFLFVQLDDTLPQVMMRRFGLTSTFALFQAINPAILLVLTFTIPFIPFVQRIKTLPRLMVGTFLQASSPFWAAVFDKEWAVAVFLVQFSLGEALAIPMVQEYSMQIAPKGQEALYSSMSSIPKIVGRVASLALSSVLLQEFCPLVGAPCTPALIWLVVGILGGVTPVTLGLLWWRSVIE
jgi:hypothetical protein